MSLGLISSGILESTDTLMHTGFQDVGHYLLNNPAIAIFLCLGLGYLLGKFKIKSFTLGATVGTLIVGLLISFVLSSFGAFHINSLVKTIFFSLFIFTIGYEVGPAFFKSLKSSGIKLVILSTFFAISAFVVSLILFKIFKVGPGEAAGIIAGSLTQSAVLGTANETIKTVMTGSAATKALSELPVAYAITYVFGTVGVILFLKNFAPKLMGVDLKEATKEKIVKTNFKVPGGNGVISSVKARAFSVCDGSSLIGKTIVDIEKNYEDHLSFEQIFRNDKIVTCDDKTTITKGDIVVLIGNIDSMVKIEKETLQEISDNKYLKIAPDEAEIILLKNFKLDTIKKLSQMGIVISSMKRGDVDVDSIEKLQTGDRVKVVGPKATLTKIVKDLGYKKDTGEQSDISFLSIGLVVGILIGAISFKISGIPITLGSGGGALFGGLIFGWYQDKHSNYGLVPSATRWFLKSYGLNLFIAIVGLMAGSTFLTALKEMGVMVLVIGIIVTLAPHILTVFFGRFILKLDAVDVIGGLAGAGTCTAALNGVIDETGSSIFAMSYTPAYAVGNILITILGPLIVSVLH